MLTVCLILVQNWLCPVSEMTYTVSSGTLNYCTIPYWLCFRGLIPRLIGDLLTVWLANIMTYVLNSATVKSSQPGAKVCYIRQRGYVFISIS